jgi:hypothetical protein
MYSYNMALLQFTLIASSAVLQQSNSNRLQTDRYVTKQGI